jgi:hypothetical protein
MNMAYGDVELAKWSHDRALDECRRLRAEINRLRAELEQAKSIILGAQVFVNVDNWRADAWHRDAAKWLAAAPK